MSLLHAGESGRAMAESVRSSLNLSCDWSLATMLDDTDYLHTGASYM